jgi:hypothetical protein
MSSGAADSRLRLVHYSHRTDPKTLPMPVTL